MVRELKVEELTITMKVVTFQAKPALPVWQEFGFPSKAEFFEAMVAVSPELQALKKALSGADPV